MTTVGTPLRDADHALARRDRALPCLEVLLDDDFLSAELGEAVHITRVRYKPGTSALAAFVRTRGAADYGAGRGADGGAADYGWALTTAGNVKLLGRADSSDKRGGGVRLVRPAAPGTDALIALGGIADDWVLRKNLRWLGEHGPELLGVVRHPGPGPGLATARVLRYKPERRLVLLERTARGPIVTKTSALPVPDTAGRFHARLADHGVPVLPLLANAACLRHGTTATAAWGDGDLTASADPASARTAGSALARLHRIPADPANSGPAPAPGAALERQLAATWTMVAALVPALEAPAAEAAARIRRALRGRRPSAGRAGRTAVLVHGDFSADQVLVSGAEVRLIDFDRSQAGVPEADLGSFAAVEELRRWSGHPGTGGQAGHLIEGYLQAGGQADPAAVDAWAALRMFATSVEPFRDRTPDWAAVTGRHIARALELVR